MKTSSGGTVRLGVVGLGNMGANHARNILVGKVPGAVLAAVCDARDSALGEFTAGGAAGFTTPEAMIASGTVDAVVIATPHFSHVPIGIAALEAGLHVLCEKPLAVHKADAERLLAAHVAAAGRGDDLKFGIVFNVRTQPRYQRLRELVQSGELGEIRRVQWTCTDWFRPEVYYRSGSWRATWAGEGGGILVNQLPHDLDLFTWIFGMPRRVRGFCRFGQFHDIEVEDDLTAYFEFDHGASGVLVANTGEAPGTDRREIAAERGRVVMEADHLAWTRNVVPTSEFSRTTTGPFSKPDTWQVRVPITGVGGGHNAVIANFVDAILHDTPLMVPAAEGLRSIELANAILLSSVRERTLELPLDGAAYETFLNEKMATSRFQPTAG